MAYDKTKPLTFQLPDGDCNVMTVDYFLNMMTEVIQPIISSEKSINDSIDRISNRVQTWIDQN